MAKRSESEKPVATLHEIYAHSMYEKTKPFCKKFPNPGDIDSIRKKLGLVSVPIENHEATTLYANYCQNNFGDYTPKFMTFGGLMKKLGFPPTDNIAALYTAFWNHNVHCLVSLTKKETEGQEHHLAKLAGKTIGKFTFGELEVSEDTEELAVHKLTLFYQHDASSERYQEKLTQIHYKAWSDHGPIGSDEEALAKTIRLIETIQQYCPPESTITVNCNAGVSRSSYTIKALMAYNLHRLGIEIDPATHFQELEANIPCIDTSRGKQTAQLFAFIDYLNSQLARTPAPQEEKLLFMDAFREQFRCLGNVFITRSPNNTYRVRFEKVSDAVRFETEQLGSKQGAYQFGDIPESDLFDYLNGIYQVCVRKEGVAISSDR